MRKLILNYDNQFSDDFVTVTTQNVVLVDDGGAGGKNKGYTTAQITDWWDTDFFKRVTVTIDHTKIDSDLTDFRLCIVLDDTNFDFDVAQDNGEDIRVIDSDSETELKYDIFYYNKTDELAIIFCKVPSISSSTDKEIYVYYYDPGAEDNQSTADVWPVSDYIAVIGFDEDSGTYYDRTANDNDATNNGTTRVASATLDGARQYNGTSDYISIADSATQDVTDNVTLTAHVNATSYTGTALRNILNHDLSSVKYAIAQNDGGEYIFQCRTSSGLRSVKIAQNLFGNYHFVSGIYKRAESPRLRIYIDTAYQNTLAGVDEPILAGDEGIMFGRSFIGGVNYYWPGILDMITIEKVSRELAWHKARYYAELNQSLLSFETHDLSEILGGELTILFEPGSFGTAGFEFPLEFDNVGSSSGWIGAVAYAGLYDGELIVTVYDEEDNVFLETVPNKVIDLRTGSNSFPLEFPIEFGFNSNTIKIKFEFIIDETTDIPSVLEELQIWYQVVEDLEPPYTTTLDEIEIKQELDMLKIIRPSPVIVPIPGAEHPVAYRTYGVSVSYIFDTTILNEDTATILIDLIDNSVTWTTRAFSDEWKNIEVFVENVAEKLPIQNEWVYSLRLKEVQ